MNTEDYPALYQLANKTSQHAQREHLSNMRAHGYTLIAAAISSSFGIQEGFAPFGTGLLILLSIGLTLLILFKKNERCWYNSRALAESVKTSTWRFMMKAAPYNGANAKDKFIRQLTKLRNEHTDLASELAQNIENTVQITSKMKKAHQLSILERKEFYSKERIEEQLEWYQKKSRYNATQEKRWFALIIISQGLAIAFVIFRLYKPEFKLWPVEPLLVATSVIFSWIQIKRFRELSAAYTLTAIDISLLKEDLDNLNNNEQSLSKFVSDSESAFSREHTQWLARKDSIK